MATRQSTSKARSRRNSMLREDGKQRAAARLHGLFRATPRVPEIPLQEAIEDERDRLGKADSVLGCLSMALMDAEEGQHRDLPYFADVADVARKLVRKSINKLDSVRIGPLIDRLGDARKRS